MNRLKNRTVNKLALVALLFAAALPLAPKVYGTPFNNSSLTGTYGYSLYGWFVSPPGGSGVNIFNIPGAAAGIMTFDGNGGFTWHDTIDLGGVIHVRGTVTSPLSGTYTVNSDGTGTMQFTYGFNHIRAFVITNGGNELQFSAEENFAVNFGVAKKQ